MACVGAAVQVSGTGLGGKERVELLKAAALAPYAGKRARKGKPLVLSFKPTRVTGG